MRPAWAWRSRPLTERVSMLIDCRRKPQILEEILRHWTASKRQIRTGFVEWAHRMDAVPP